MSVERIMGGALVTVLALLVLSWIITAKRAANLVLARKHRDEFFETANQLAGDARLGNSLGLGLLLLGSGMTKTVVAYSLFLDGAFAPRRRTLDPKGIVTAVDSLPKDLKVSYLRACRTALLALSYQSVVVGPFLRRMLASDRSRNGNSDKKQRREKTEKLLGKVVRFELRHAA